VTKIGERDEDASLYTLRRDKSLTVKDAIMPDEITFDDCCRIILEQGPLVDRPYAPDRATYRRDLLALLNKEFGIEWNDMDKFQSSPDVLSAEGRRLNQGVPAIAENLVRHYGEVPDPFSGYYEYTFAKREMEVWKAHETLISDAATAMKRCLVGFFRDLLLLRWPKAAHRTTSWTKLRAHGLVEPTDELDFF
jgi:hypothetical protein